MDAPLCGCHGVPMYWAKMKKLRAGGLWRCRIARRRLDAARWQGYYYERMPAPIRIRRDLASRRRLALKSRRRRHERMEELRNG